MGFLSGVAVVHFRGAAGPKKDQVNIALSPLYDPSQKLLVAPTASLAGIHAAGSAPLLAVDSCTWTTQRTGEGHNQIVLQAHIAASPTEAVLLRVSFQASIIGVRVGAARETPESVDFELAPIIE
jgi:hypothetical protein